MKLTPVENLPKKGLRHDLQGIIKEFAESNQRNVLIVLKDGEYKSIGVCRSCFGVAIKKSGYAIRVCTRDGKVYLTKDLKD